MHRTSLLLALGLAIAGVSAEYIWTGTEWKWKNPETPGGASDTLGTNTDTTWDDEDEDNYDEYDEEYYEEEISKPDNNKYDFNDYNKNNKKEKKQKEKKNRNKNRDSQFYPSNSNSAILPATDDEDLFNGSGDYDDTEVEYVPPPTFTEMNFSASL